VCTGSSLYIQITEQTAHVVVPHAIKTLKAKGYKLVTVAECLGMNPYQSVGTPQSVSPVCLRPGIAFSYQFLSGLVDMLVPRTKDYIGNSFFPDHEPLSWTWTIEFIIMSSLCFTLASLIFVSHAYCATIHYFCANLPGYAFIYHSIQTRTLRGHNEFFFSTRYSITFSRTSMIPLMHLGFENLSILMQKQWLRTRVFFSHTT
jgi:hypothetical protein